MTIGKIAPALEEAARNDPESGVRGAALTAIGRLQAIEAVGAVVDALDDSDEAVRERAIRAFESTTGLGLDYRPDGTPQERKKAIAQANRLLARFGGFIEHRLENRRRRAAGLPLLPVPPEVEEALGGR
jgi:HEAT repeat protein